MKEITRYQASWGAWYVQVLLDDGRRIELKFKEEPKIEEVEKVALSLPAVEILPEPPQLVELTVDTALAYLDEKLLSTDMVEKTKITAYITDTTDELKVVEKSIAEVTK